jgi:hypothetical protein
MSAVATAELTLQDRAILASSASAAYLDHFSIADRVLVPVWQQPVQVTRKRTYYSRGQAYTIGWRDFGQPLPAWFDPLVQGFVDLLTLPPNWDSYQAGTIDSQIVHDAMNFINGVLGTTSPAPRVVPLSSGGLQLEWHRKGIDLEVVFDRGEQPFFYYRNRVNHQESEHFLPEENSLLGSIIANLE